MQSNAFQIFGEKFSKGERDRKLVRTLYLVMEKVGGYEQLVNLPLPALNVIIECMKWESNERRRKR